MLEAYRLTRKDGAPGIDGVMAADSEVNLEANLLSLLERIKSGPRAAGPSSIHSQSGWLAEDARHSNLRRQGGATRRDDGAGGNL
jgi:hypothetical protein